MAKRIIKPKEEAQKIIDWIKNYFVDNGGNDPLAVIGISGGKDSTVVAYLCAAALGAHRVVGVKMPQGEQYDIDCADRVIKELGIEEYEINIGDICNSVYKELEIADIDLAPIVTNNIPPRIRMTVLYAVAGALGGRVANTSNYSERFVGWSTKWGDGVGDFAPLANYTVTEVLQIGQELGIPNDLLFKTPEDGLTGKSDEDNLGVGYDVIDNYIRNLDDPLPEHDALRIIKNRNKYSKHKFYTANLPSPLPIFYDSDTNERAYAGQF